MTFILQREIGFKDVEGTLEVQPTTRYLNPDKDDTTDPKEAISFKSKDEAQEWLGENMSQALKDGAISGNWFAENHYFVKITLIDFAKAKSDFEWASKTTEERHTINKINKAWELYQEDATNHIVSQLIRDVKDKDNAMYEQALEEWVKGRKLDPAFVELVKSI